jgi:putative PIN family toxin of toxin-antitoxin system
MGTIKAVLDTNILISALIGEGPPKKIFELCIEGKIKLVTSIEQLSELERVWNRQYLNIDTHKKALLQAVVETNADIISVPGVLQIIARDLSDNVILETALVGRANVLITGDAHLLEFRDACQVRIITASEFLRTFHAN